MKDEQRKRIIDPHRHSIWMYGPTLQALYIESIEAQEVRFDVLLDCGLKTGDSVLDVGCGFADFYHYMSVKGLEVDHAGIDLSPDMIETSESPCA